jgi:hypothetical protein
VVLQGGKSNQIKEAGADTGVKLQNPASKRKQKVACFLRSQINKCGPASFRVLRKMQVSAQPSERIDREGQESHVQCITAVRHM